jgi:enamine deaminase RidA (YjgF/YER057c/UK114 family)
MSPWSKGSLAAVACATLTVMGCAPAQFSFARIDPPNLNKHPAYSQVTVVSGPMKFVFVAGTVDRPLDYAPGSNRCEHEDWADQYRGHMQKIEESLKAVGATWDDVVFIRRFTVDVKKYLATVYDPRNAIPKQWKNRPPPSTLIGVTALSEPCQLMETDVLAVIHDKR